MKKKLLTLSVLTALAGAFGVAPAMAQSTYTPGIDRSHQDISARIQQGIQAGQITPAEAQELNRRGVDIENRQNRIKSDGTVTQSERQQLRYDLDNLRNDVERKLSNAQVVGRPVQGNNTPGIDRSQQEIHARIEQGMKSGHITPSEAQDLLRRERDIQNRENRIKSDGSTSQGERQQLRQELDGLRAEVERKIANNDVVRSPVTPGIERREINIRERVREGIRTGRISQGEARRLERRERDILRKEARIKSDGTVSREERRALRRELEALSDEVERMINNDRRADYRGR